MKFHLQDIILCINVDLNPHTCVNITSTFIPVPYDTQTGLDSTGLQLDWTGTGLPMWVQLFLGNIDVIWSVVHFSSHVAGNHGVQQAVMACGGERRRAARSDVSQWWCLCTAVSNSWAGIKLTMWVQLFPVIVHYLKHSSATSSTTQKYLVCNLKSLKGPAAGPS